MNLYEQQVRHARERARKMTNAELIERLGHINLPNPGTEAILKEAIRRMGHLDQQWKMVRGAWAQKISASHLTEGVRRAVEYEDRLDPNWRPEE